MTPILIEEAYWMNSQMSVARFYGGMKFNGEEYVIVPPKNDLIQVKWVDVYRKLGLSDLSRMELPLRLQSRLLKQKIMLNN